MRGKKNRALHCFAAFDDFQMFVNYMCIEPFSKKKRNLCSYFYSRKSDPLVQYGTVTGENPFRMDPGKYAQEHKRNYEKQRFSFFFKRPQIKCFIGYFPPFFLAFEP